MDDLSVLALIAGVFALIAGVLLLVIGYRASRLASTTVKMSEKTYTRAAAADRSASIHKKETKLMLDELYVSASGSLEPLARSLSVLDKPEQDSVWKYLLHKPQPAKKSADNLKAANQKYRELRKVFSELQTRTELYERLAPWLVEHADIPVRDMLEAMLEEQKIDAGSNNSAEGEEEAIDPIAKYITAIEWKTLTRSVASQLALDRYLDPKRKRDLWKLGIAYERYVGWVYEDQGWNVIYHGATKGKEDLGIDLVCKNNTDGRLEIVQCKRLSAVKELPVRENVVAQTYGAAYVWCMRHKYDPALMTPVIVTSYELSEEARQFAEVLKVRIEEDVTLKPYLMIKCNISKGESKEKIFHLPMDQMYDKVKIDPPDECYVTTVSEAESIGFRRAYRWMGEKSA